MSSKLRTALRLLVVVLGAGAVAIALLWGLRTLPREWLDASNDEVGNYLQSVGTIYAVLLAFVVYVVWGQFNDARVQVDREANEVIDLYRIADGLPDAAGHQVQASLDRYVTDVIEREWPAMAGRDERVFEAIGAHLDAVWGNLHGLQTLSDCQQALHAEALSRFNDLSDARTSRLTSARTHIPFGLKLLLYIGAVVMMVSMYLIYVESFLVQAIITGAMAGAISHVLYVVIDLDDAFGGDWVVSSDAFERVQRYMERRNSARAAALPADRVAVLADDTGGPANRA